MKNVKNYQKVYDFLVTIPKGKVVTYGYLAKKLKLGSPRYVGRILHENPSAPDVPCHRVVFSDGSLSPNFGSGPGVQKKLLEKEGLQVVNDKVDLSKSLYTQSA